MARYAYDRLTFLDNSFLIMEKENTPMHIAGTATFDAAPLTRADGGIDIDRIRAYIESRLHLIPRYRQRLQHSWFHSAPIWVDYEHFNIHYHVRHTALPRPGDERQLKRLAARIMAQHLDRSKPLWEIWIVEGLDDGKRFAMISKIHHCMVDGVSSVDLLNVLLTPQPIDDLRAAPRSTCRGPLPTELDLLLETAGTVARLPFEIGKNVADLRRRQVQRPASPTCAPASVRCARCSARGFGVSDTPLNQTVGPAPPLRLAGDEPRRDQGRQGPPRRHRQRRRAGDRRRRRAPLPRAPRRQLRAPRLPRDGAGQRARRRTSAARSATASRRGSCRCRSASATRAAASSRSARRRRT